MDDLDRQLLTLLRRGLSLERRPFERLARELLIEPSEVLLRIGRLKAEGTVRKLAARFDIKKLGYKTSLVAMSFEKDELDQKAAIVNEHPGISYSCARYHEFNLWFTLSVPPGEFLEHHVARLHEVSGAKKNLLLPITKILKNPLTEEVPAIFNPALDPVFSRSASAEEFSEREIRLIRILQEDLPLVDDPYARLARAAEISESEFLGAVKALKERGIFSGPQAVLENQRSREAHHTLIVWNIPEESIEKLGGEIAASNEVIHLSVRRLYRDFPYSVYAMVRASGFSFAEVVAQKIESRIGNWPRACLMIAKLYKKSKIHYFSEELENWWRASEERPARRKASWNETIPSAF